jgi:hypothetical protein
MKSLTFTITVEGLPDHAKDYRVQGNICMASTELLRKGYPDGAINVIVAPAATAKALAPQTEDDGVRRMRAYVAGEQKKWNKKTAP